MQHGVLCGSQTYGLALNETLITEYLNQLGYVSHMVGNVRCHLLDILDLHSAHYFTRAIFDQTAQISPNF